MKIVLSRVYNKKSTRKVDFFVISTYKFGMLKTTLQKQPQQKQIVMPTLVLGELCK
jgi:hypothetical protein